MESLSALPVTEATTATQQTLKSELVLQRKETKPTTLHTSKSAEALPVIEVSQPITRTIELTETSALDWAETSAIDPTETSDTYSTETPALDSMLPVLERRSFQKETNPIVGNAVPVDTSELLKAVSAVLRSEINSLKQEERPDQPLPVSCEQDETVVKQLSMEETRLEQSKQTEKSPSEDGVHVPDTAQKRDVMQFFLEQEQSLHDSFHLLPQTAHKSTRPLTPKAQKAAGLEHLDNLIRLMQQLTSLKDENNKLRKRCDYLESSRTLLEAKRDFTSEDSSSSLSFITPPSHRKHHHRHNQQEHVKVKLSKVEDLLCRYQNIQNRTRISNSEEREYLSLANSSSDTGSKKDNSTRHRRSHSADFLDTGDCEVGLRKKGQTRLKIPKDKIKSSKWTRVKKVISGQKFYEDLGSTIRTIRDRGRSSRGDAGTSHKGSPREIRAVASKLNVSSAGSARGLDEVKARPVNVSLDVPGSAGKSAQGNHDPELTSDIWMGPPDWWEEYESRKDTGDPTTNSQTDYVIEVTTLYFGQKKDATVSTIEVPNTAASFAKLQEKSLTTGNPLQQGTTSSSVIEAAKTENPNDGLDTECAKKLHKSSSCKYADLYILQISEQPNSTETKQDRKPQRSAWSRVKDIIHTRRDSIKKKLKKDRLENEDMLDSDMQTVADPSRLDHLSEGPLNRRSAKTSPTGFRQHKTGDPLQEDKSHNSKPSNLNAGSGRGNVDLATILGGSISEEFSKKMLEWEQLKSKKHVLSVPDDSDLGSIDLPKLPREFPVCTIDLRDLRGKVPDTVSDVITTEESNTSMEVLGAPSISVDETPTHRTAGFQSTMQDWDKQKLKDNPSLARDNNSSAIERKGSKKLKDETRKSKRSRDGKEKERRSRQTDQGKQKTDKDGEKVDKERTRTSDCEAKLELLNGQINQIGSGTSSQNGSPHEEQGQAGNSIEDGDSARGCEDLKRDSTEGTSPVETDSEASGEEVEDESSTTVSQYCLTTSNIATLERANSQLLENLHKKEIDYAAVQEEVQLTNEKLAKIREDHAVEMARFHSDLAMGKFAGPVKLEVGELEVTVGVLEEKIKMMEKLGEKLASSMESAAAGKWQSIEAEETIHNQLVDLIEQMRNMLVQASQTEEQSLKMMALSNFETLYAQAMKLQVQMNNLRLSHLERNREIMVIKRQLLLQEVNNLLLQADITRRETELYQFQEAKRFPAFGRWNTFTGTDRSRPQVQVELAPPAVAPASLKAGPQKDARSRQGDAPRINIPYLPEEMNLTPAASSTIPAPATPMASVDAFSTVQSTSIVDCQVSTNGASTTEPDPSAGGHHRHLSPLLGTYLAQQQDECTKTFDCYQEEAGSAKFPKFSNRIPSRICEPEQPEELPVPPVVKPKAERKFSISSFKIKKPLKSSQIDYSGKFLSTEATTKPSVGQRLRKASLTIFGLTTVCDSVPLHMEIAELRRVKCQVEKEVSAAIGTVKEESSSWDLNNTDSSIPEDNNDIFTKQKSRRKKKIRETAQSSSDYPKAVSTVKRSDTSQTGQQTENNTCKNFPNLKVVSSKPPIADRHGLHLQLGMSQQESEYKSRNAQTHNSSQQQRLKEETDIQNKDCRTASPRRSPAGTRGKPPLPRHASPSKALTSNSPVVRKELRSKSVGDIDPDDTAAITSKPLQEFISKFQRQDTVTQTENSRTSKLRKLPSPTLHLPMVGLVARVRIIKPAAELLEESKRYRSGNSISASRILQKYFPKDEQRAESLKSIHHSNDRLDTPNMRDTTQRHSTSLSRSSSDLSLRPADPVPADPGAADADRSSVRGRSSSEGPEPKNRATCLNNKTATQTLNNQHKQGFPVERFTHQDNGEQSNVPVGPKAATTSCTPAEKLLSSSPDISNSDLQCQTSPQAGLSVGNNTSLVQDSPTNSSTNSPTKQTSYHSLPSFESPEINERTASSDKEANEPSIDSETPKEDHSRRNNNPKSLSASTPASPSLHKHEEKSKWKSENISRDKSHADRISSSCFQDRRNVNRVQAETIAKLCEQSILLDLALFGYSQRSGQVKFQLEPGSRLTHSWDSTTSNCSENTTSAEADTSSRDVSTALSPASMSSKRQSSSSSSSSITNEAYEDRPASSSSENGSTTPPKKHKCTHFIDSNCLQKSKKLFKISK